jgi:serine/threonine protein phosphatase PrpC
MVRCHARTDVGLKRKHNEDSLLAAEEHGVFVVADGVGGRKAGELASAITVNTFQSFAPQLQEGLEQFIRAPSREHRNEVLRQLDEAANAASRRVYEAATSTGRQGMTTTLVTAIIGGGHAFILHVGDSRGYLLRNGTLQQLTEDHSMVNELIRTGSMTPEEAATSRYRNVITRAVGLYPSVRTDILHVELLPQDRILLCSDGLSDMVSHEGMQGRLGALPLIGAVDALIQDALNGGGKDNITVIALEPEASQEPDQVEARAAAMASLFLFEELPLQARLRVGRIVNELHPSAGDYVMRQGDGGDTLFAVVSGSFSVRIKGQEVAQIGPGEHFGELALVDSLPRSADVVANTDGHLLAIERSALQDFCRVEPALGNLLLWKLVTTLGYRLRATNERLMPPA